MSWTMNEDGEILNLDKIERLGVRELEEPSDTQTHCVIAADSVGPEDILYSGTEDKCKDYLMRIFKKLHQVP